MSGWWGTELPAGLSPELYEMGCAPDFTVVAGTPRQRIVPASVRASHYREAGLHFHIDVHPSYLDPLQLPVLVADLHRVFGPIQQAYIDSLDVPCPITWYRRPKVYRLQGSNTGKQWIEYRSLSAICLNDRHVLTSLIEAAFDLSAFYGGEA